MMSNEAAGGRRLIHLLCSLEADIPLWGINVSLVAQHKFILLDKDTWRICSTILHIYEEVHYMGDLVLKSSPSSVSLITKAEGYVMFKMLYTRVSVFFFLWAAHSAMVFLVGRYVAALLRLPCQITSSSCTGALITCIIIEGSLVGFWNNCFVKNRSTAQGHREGGEREEWVGKKREKERKKSQKLVAARWRVARTGLDLLLQAYQELFFCFSCSVRC